MISHHPIFKGRKTTHTTKKPIYCNFFYIYFFFNRYFSCRSTLLILFRPSFDIIDTIVSVFCSLSTVENHGLFLSHNGHRLPARFFDRQRLATLMCGIPACHYSMISVFFLGLSISCSDTSTTII